MGRSKRRRRAQKSKIIRIRGYRRDDGSTVKAHKRKRPNPKASNHREYEVDYDEK